MPPGKRNPKKAEPPPAQTPKGDPVTDRAMRSPDIRIDAPSAAETPALSGLPALRGCLKRKRSLALSGANVPPYLPPTPPNQSSDHGPPSKAVGIRSDRLIAHKTLPVLSNLPAFTGPPSVTISLGINCWRSNSPFVLPVRTGHVGPKPARINTLRLFRKVGGFAFSGCRLWGGAEKGAFFSGPPDAVRNR